MYTDEDLSNAVDQHIFTEESVRAFRNFICESKQSDGIDEENFKLINGFNDIFVVIASALLLVSTGWLGYEVAPPLGGLVVAMGAWGLAEYFVQRRKMALPAIALLLSFIAGLFSIPVSLSMSPEPALFLAGAITSAVGAVAHWKRFRVPITVAAGTLSLVIGVFAALFYFFPPLSYHINSLLLVSGLLIFGLAMYWDSQDRTRQTRSSDVAFWLHLVSAPMIVHPIFNSLGVMDGNEGLGMTSIVVALYVLLGLVSIIVDRRAIMVSALIYVVYAFSSLMQLYGMVSYSFAAAGFCIGSGLLLLSAYWHVCRKSLLKHVPQSLQLKLPAIHS